MYLVLGEEDYFRERAVEEIWSAILGSASSVGSGEQKEGVPPDPTQFAGEVLYGDETDASEIMNRCLEVPLFSAYPLVIVKWGEKLSAGNGEGLIPYFQKPSTSSTLVVVASKLDGRLKWVQALKRHAVMVECVPLFDNQRLPWIKQEATRLGVKLSQETAHMLKELAGEGLFVVRRELDKLRCYLPQGQMVVPKHIEEIQGVEPGISVFELASAIGSRNTGLALSILVKNLDTGEAPLRILGSLIWQYRRLWKASDGLDCGENQATVARALGIPPFRQQDFFSQLRHFPSAHFKQAFRLFLETDSALKGGRAGTSQQILESLVLSLCSGSPQAMIRS
jgi:DNA polymerase-3 subunit delta